MDCDCWCSLAGCGLGLGLFLALDAHNPDAGYYHATVEPSLSVWKMDASDFNSPLERLEFLYAAKQFNYAMFKQPAETMPLIAGKYLDMLGKNFAPISLALMGTVNRYVHPALA